MIDGTTALYKSERHGHCIAYRIYPDDGSTGGPYYQISWVNSDTDVGPMSFETFSIWAEHQELKYLRTIVDELVQ